MIFLFTFLLFTRNSSLLTESARPEFKVAEIKITYPCEALDSFEKDEESDDVVTFYDWEDYSFYKSGYIFRKRAKGFTLKYRAPTVLIKNSIYAEIESSGEGELKCELDVSTTTVQSCSYEAEALGKEHSLFLDMIIGPRPNFNPKEMRAFSASVKSFKVILSDDKQKKNPFKKRPDLEMWEKGSECRLEVSGKLQLRDDSLQKGFEFLKSLTPFSPSLDQSSKTAWVLGIKD